MALQISYSDTRGNTYGSAYAKIVQLGENFLVNVANCSVSIYKDADARTNELEIVGSISVPVDIDLTRAQIYTYLKTLDEFSGAIDV